MKSIAAPAVLAVGLVVGLAACSGAGDKDSGPKRSVTDATGRQVKVPEHPKRVVALSEPDEDSAFALGVKPVGVANGRGQKTPPRYLAGKVAGIPVLGDIGKPNLDKVVEADPDIILIGGSAGADRNLLGQLGKIAPTVVTAKAGDDWKATLAQVSGALGKDPKPVLAAYDTKLAATKSALGKNAKAKVSIVRWNPQGPVVMTNAALGTRVVSDLGLTFAAAGKQGQEQHSAPLSLENLHQIDGDWIFLGTLNAAGPDVQALATAKKTPAFERLAAVRENHVVGVDGSVWTSAGGPLAADTVLDDVKKAMAG